MAQANNRSALLKVSNGVVYKAVANSDKDTLAPSVTLSNHSSSLCKLNNAQHTSPIISQTLCTQDEKQSWTCDFDGKLTKNCLYCQGSKYVDSVVRGCFSTIS